MRPINLIVADRCSLAHETRYVTYCQQSIEVANGTVNSPMNTRQLAQITGIHGVYQFARRYCIPRELDVVEVVCGLRNLGFN